MPTKEKKFAFLKKVYFGVSDNPDDDVNPYSDLESFGNAPVGSMRWGQNPDVIKRSKLRFSHNYSQVLKNFKVSLSVDDIFNELEDERTNDQVVTKWIDHAVFN